MALIIDPEPQEDSPVIDDATAHSFMERLDTAGPDERPTIEAKLLQYADAQDARKREVQGEHFAKLYTDDEFFKKQSRQPAVVDAMAASLIPETLPIRAANQAYLEFATGKQPGELTDTYEHWRDGFGQKANGKPTITDQEMFSLVRDNFTGEKKRAMDEQLILGDVMNGLFEEATTGVVQTGAAALQKYKTENPDFAKGLKPGEEAQYLNGLMATREDLREKFDKYAPTAKRLYDEVTSQTGQKEGSGAKNVIGEIANMPKADQDILFSAVLLAAQRSGFDPKGFLKQTAETLGRATIGTMNQTVRVTMEDGLRNKLRSLNQLDVPEIKYGGPRSMDEIGAFAMLGPRSRSGFEESYPTPESRAKAKEEIQDQLNVIGVIRKIDNLSQEADPIKVVSKSWLGQVAEKSVYGVAGSAGIMASSMIPVIGPALTFAAYRAGNYERLRNEAPDLAPETASSYATVMAIPESILDRFQMGILFRKAPIFSKTLKAMTLSKKGMVGKMANFGKTASVMTAAETGIELVQNFIPLVVDQLGMALEEDYPQHNFREDLAQYRDAIPETIGTMLIMSMFGAGFATISDTRNGRHLLEFAQPMTDSGISDEGAAKIITAPTEEEKLAIFIEEAAKRTPESIAAGVAASNERVANQKANQAQEGRSELTVSSVLGDPDENGNPAQEWTLTDSKGQVVIKTRDQAAALMAKEEADRAWMTGKTSGIAEGLEHIKAVNEAIGRGEDVQKILLGKGSQSFLEIYNADKTPEHLDRLFETVRSHGYEIKEVEQLAGYFVKASNRGRLKDGIYKSIIAVSDGADGIHLMRDYSQDNLRRAIEEGDTTIEWVRDQLDLLKGHKEFANLLTETDTNVIEAFSDVAVSYFLGRTKESQIPSGLRTFMRQIAVFLREILVRSYRLKRAIAAGDVNQNFQQLLATSTGLDVDQIARMEGEKEGRRMQQEALDSVNAGEGTPGVELLDVLTSSAEKLPDTKSPFFTPEIGRLKELVQQLGKGEFATRKKMRIKDLFSNDAKDPDLLVGAFNEAGHAFFTVDDMVQALEERIRTGKAQVGTISSDAVYGDGNYSISKKQDAEYMAAVESGDVETQQAMVDEAAMAAGYAPQSKFRDGHSAPSNSRATDEQVKEDGADAALDQVARGVHNQPADYFDPVVGPRFYSYTDKNGMEAYRAIKAAMVAINKGKSPNITVYRAVPLSVKNTRIENRDWVSPSRGYAVDHGESRFGEGEYRIIKESIPSKELFWDGIDIREWGKDDDQNRVYKNTENNIKSADPITRDESGNVIPLSERFKPESDSINYSIGTKAFARHADLEAKHKAGTITEAETAEAQALVDAAAMKTIDKVPKSKAFSALSESESSEFLQDIDGFAPLPNDDPTKIDIFERWISVLKSRGVQFLDGYHVTNASREDVVSSGIEGSEVDLIGRTGGNARGNSVYLFLETDEILRSFNGVMGAPGFTPNVIHIKIPLNQLGNLRWDSNFNVSYETRSAVRVLDDVPYDNVLGVYKIEIPGTDPFTGVPLDQRFDSSQDSINYSISKGTTDRVQAALEDRLNRSPDARLALYKRAKVKFDEVRKDRGNSTDPNRKFSSLLQSMRELNAILIVLPKDIRGKVGGMMPLANMGKDTIQGNQVATVDKFLEKRIAMIDKELERVLKKEYLAGLRKLIKKLQPVRSSGGAAKSFLGDTAQEIAIDAGKLALLTNDEVAKEMLDLDAAMNEGRTDQNLYERWSMLNMFGDLKGRDAATLAIAFDWLKKVAQEGRDKTKMTREAHFASLKEIRSALLDDIGRVELSDSFRASHKKFFGRAGDWSGSVLRNHLSFEQFLATIFQNSPEQVKYFFERMMKADNADQDMRIRYSLELLATIKAGANAAKKTAGKAAIDLMAPHENAVIILENIKTETAKLTVEQAEKMALGEIDSGKFTKEEIQDALDSQREELAERDAKAAAEGRDNAPLAQREFVEVSRRVGVEKGATLSRNQAIQLLLTWNQRDGRKKMKLGEWREDTGEQLQAFIEKDPVAVKVMDFLQKFYSEGAARVNPVYVRIFGMNMPTGENYAPASYDHQGDEVEIGPDGMATSGGSTPGFLKGRVSHKASVSPSGAITIFQQHLAQQSHWVNFAELGRDFKHIFADADMKKSLRAKFGNYANEEVSKWTSLLETRGGDRSNSMAWMNGLLGTLIGGKAISSLGFNMRTLTMQTDAGMRFMFAMEPGEVVRAFSDPAALVKSMPAIWFSEAVQRRIKGGMSPAMQFVFQQYSAKPGVMANVAHASMAPINRTDAFFTTIGSAIVFRSAYTTAVAEGMNEKMAVDHAMKEVDKAIYRFSQPIGVGQKSLIENSGNILTKSIMMFMSDARFKSAMMIEAGFEIKKIAEEGKGNWQKPLKTILTIEAMAFISHSMGNLYRTLLSDDEPEDIWARKGYYKALALAPFAGLMFGGTIADVTLSKLFHERFFMPSRDPVVDTAMRGLRTLNNIDETFNVDDPEEMYRQWRNISKTISVTPGLAAPAAALNLISPAFGLAERLKEMEK